MKMKIYAVGLCFVPLVLTGTAAGQDVPQRAPLDSRSIMATLSNDFSLVKKPATNAPVEAAAPEIEDQAMKTAFLAIDDGNSEKAIRLFQEILAKDPKNKRARFGLSAMYIKLEDYKKALEILEVMTVEFPDDYSLKNNIAWLYATAKDHSIRNASKAITYAQEALMGNPIDYHVWSTLSEAYYMSTQYDKALRAAGEALRLAQQREASKADIGEYKAQMDKCTKAAAAMSIIE